ncbi:MAG TPA: hypothetical protein VEH47_07790 [Candidatus Acidoferrales bacterium]|nr:hypothetical protein [Candidatus Acidoferrales bacterium]
MRKVLAMCLAIGFVFALSAMAFDDMGKSTTVNGWVVDDKCGAKAAHEGSAECTKKCLAAGAKMVIVTDGDQKVITVENPDALKGHEGHHVAVTGTMGKDSIKVESAKML